MEFFYSTRKKTGGVDCGEEASKFFERLLNLNGVRLLQLAPEGGFRPSTAQVNDEIRHLENYPVKIMLKNLSILINLNKL